jgi:arabinoxylan arabinofuranohydrolase
MRERLQSPLQAVSIHRWCRRWTSTVSINVNGEAIDLPVTPVSATGDNGIVGYDLYETTHTIAAGTSETPRVSVSASDARLNVSVAQATSIDDTAVVTCDLNGVEKTYKILFSSAVKKGRTC